VHLRRAQSISGAIEERSSNPFSTVELCYCYEWMIPSGARVCLSKDTQTSEHLQTCTFQGRHQWVSGTEVKGLQAFDVCRLQTSYQWSHGTKGHCWEGRLARLGGTSNCGMSSSQLRPHAIDNFPSSDRLLTHESELEGGGDSSKEREQPSDGGHNLDCRVVSRLF
jgi:hypothetical protein